MLTAIHHIHDETLQLRTADVSGLYIGRTKGVPMQTMTYLRVIPGKGIVGDRHFDRSGNVEPENQVTLIESEVLDYLRDTLDIALHPADLRRNIMTTGIHLDELIGEEFMIGEVQLRGVMTCEPCLHVASGATLRGLVHRGGLRAEILTPGMIYNGDAIFMDTWE